MPSKKNKVYTFNDYSAVQSYIEARNNRIMARSNAIMNKQFLARLVSWGKWIALGLLALGTAVLLAQSYFRYESRIAEDKTLSQPNKKHDTKIQFIPVPDPNLSKTIERTVVVEKPVYIPIDAGENEGVTTNYIIFKNKKTETEASVITGWKYSSSSEKEPKYQFCYVTLNENGLIKRVNIAHKERGSVVKDLPISSFNAQQVGMSAKALRASRRHCTWHKYIPNIPIKQPPSQPSPDANKEPKFATGSGFYINTSGVLVTNRHVVKGCKKFWISTEEGNTRITLIKSSSDSDLAILKDHRKTPPPPLEIARQLRLGESVVALGFPLGNQLGSEVKVTTGNISSLAGIKNDKRFLQFTAPIQPGNSGGPLINRQGLVLGVNTATLIGDKLQNINFAVKTEQLLSFLGKARQKFILGDTNIKRTVPDLVEKVSASVVQVLCVGDTK